MKAGSYFGQSGGNTYGDGISWFMSFRGTFTFDVVNMRRNNMITLVLTSLCSQCAASVGPYMNFVAMRFSIARALVGALPHIPAAEQPLLAIVGMSMGGQLAQFASVFFSVENSLVSQNVFALITHGSPRVGNEQFARQIMSGVDVPYINFVMYRDMVPHLPPMLFGFKHASRKIIWLFIMPSYTATIELQGSPPDEYASSLRFKELTGSSADDEFSSKLTFFDIGDHMHYFIGLADGPDMAACGGFEDKFFRNSRATRMFDTNV
jgi:hypothetical protein